jgi:hypothetical protein
MTTVSQDIILAHEDACLKLSICPNSDNIVLSAGQDCINGLIQGVLIYGIYVQIGSREPLRNLANDKILFNLIQRIPTIL